MRSESSLTRGVLWCIVSGLPAIALAQNAPRVAPIPRDPMELATGQIQSLATTAQRDSALQLLNRARNGYALRNLRRPWDLKVHFTVDSRGQTKFDGDWDMEDEFAPGQGLYWTAQSVAGYSIAGIFGANDTYAQASDSIIPLRLQEARAVLYNPLPPVPYASGGSMRTVETTFRGAPVLCVLLDRSRNVSRPAAQRGWDESEDCIDSQTGLLQMHSETPGRYTVYDYTNAPRLGSHVLPRTVLVTEGGRVVSTITVKSLESVSSVDPSLFVPTDAMKAAGPAVAMTAATKISRIQGQSAVTPDMALQPVCIFGIVTPAGRLVEAHSLQPSDPNSDAALKDAEAIDFSPSMRPGQPQQHFVFVIEKFVSAN